MHQLQQSQHLHSIHQLNFKKVFTEKLVELDDHMCSQQQEDLLL